MDWVIGLMVNKDYPFLHILDDRAHMLYDWLETCTWDKVDWIIGFIVNKDCPFFCTYYILHMHIFGMFGWKHVGKIRWTESSVLWSIRTVPFFLHILHITHARILNDWLEICRWGKMDWIIGLMVNKGCLFSTHIRHMHTFCMIGWKHVGEIRYIESLVLWPVRTAPFCT